MLDTELIFKQVLIAIVSYLIGAIPFGWFIANFKGVDILSSGSGKIGFTNVQRILGLKYAIPVLVLDVAKGGACILFARAVIPEAIPGVSELIATLSAASGHGWSVIIWLMRRQLTGGTAVATVFGSMLTVSPLASLISILVTILVALTTQYMSLGVLTGMIVAMSLLLAEVAFDRLEKGYVFYAVITYLFLIWRHKRNIAALVRGTERKLGGRR